MDHSVKQMLKLIEEDADSFAKKAEMYYQKRPELVAHVEEFYRMYRSLAERYDHLTGELRKNIPSELQSQGSGISDSGSELPSIWPSTDQRLSHRKSGPGAAGFNVFLGSGGSRSDVHRKGDESSFLTDSESESDDSSVNNYSVLSGNGGDQGESRKMIELEIELREVKEKLRMLEEENTDGSLGGAKNDNSDPLARIGEYEEELKIANKKLQLSEEKIAWLKIELLKYKPLETAESETSSEESVKKHKTELEIEVNKASELQNKIVLLGKENRYADGKMRELVEELSIAKEMLQDSEKEIASLKLEKKQCHEKIQNLQSQLDTAQREIITWKAKLNTEKRDVSKLQERIAMLKNSLSDRDNEIWDLKIAVSDAEQKIFPEKAHIKAEISKLLEERICLEEQLREWESRGRSLEEEIRKSLNEKRESEEKHLSEIEQLNVEIVKRGDCIKILNENLETLKSEREELQTEIDSLEAEVSYCDDRIVQMDKNLHQLHMENMKLIATAEGAHKLAAELESKVKELEDEIKRQRIAILEGAEEKREAIRQLCFSLEHYRNGYHRLRQAFMGQKRVPVLAT